MSPVALISLLLGVQYELRKNRSSRVWDTGVEGARGVGLVLRSCILDSSHPTRVAEGLHVPLLLRRVVSFYCFGGDNDACVTTLPIPAFVANHPRDVATRHRYCDA